MHRLPILLCLFLISASATVAAGPTPASPRFLAKAVLSQTPMSDSEPDSYLESEVFNTLSDEEFVFERHSGLRFIVTFVHLAVLAGAFYTAFFGFRHYKFLLCAQAFITCFVFLVLATRHAGVFKPERISHHLGVLFVALFLAGNLLLACSVFIRLNYVFFGFSLTTVAYFFFEEAVHKRFQGVPYAGLLAALLILGTAIFAYATYRFFKLAVHVNSAVVGGFVLVLCVEVLTHNFSSFYDPNYARTESLGWFLAAWAVAAFSGFVFQSRMKVITDKQARDSDLEEINRRSYLA